MIDIKDRICDVVADKVMSAEAAAEFVKDGDNLGVSGFTPSGYPKAVPLALAEKGKKTPFKVNVWTGASVGPEIDQAMVEAGIIDRRLPYQTNGTMRKAINAGKVKYADIHLSHMAQMVRYGFMAGRPTGPDVAIVEVCKINDLGDGKVGLIPTTSMGNSSSYVAGAKKVIVEVNTTQPVGLEGMHDSYVPLDPPYRKAIPIEKPEDRIGTTYIPCEVDKIVAVVPCDITDKVRPLGEIDEDAKHMGANLVNFLKNEVKEGRLPKNLLPLQSGVGSVANAVINGLVNSDFEDLTVYTEVIQDGMFDLIDAGKLRVASGTALTPSPECQKKFYENVEHYKKYLLLRPQEISNSPEVARRIGVIAMNTAIEVDIYGNVNSTSIGDYHHPKTRFTGSGGANGIATYSNTIIMMQHEKRRFMDKIDYVTSPGWIDGPGGRERLGLPGEVGPQMVVTDRGILKFDEKTKRMYLAGYYPTSSPEDVIENTGFEIDVSRAVELEAPEPSVIKLIREEIDPGQAFIKVPVPEAK